MANIKNVTILGIPLDLGAESLGVDVGPNALRYHNIVQKLQIAGICVVDAGNIDCNFAKKDAFSNPKLKYLDEILKVNRNVAKKVNTFIGDNQIVVALGGDHSLTIGTVSGASVAVQGDIGLIYIDAHGDMNTDVTTQTGNIHGMPLAAVMGFGERSLTHLFDNSTKVQKENMLLVGVKDLDGGEKALIKDQNLYTFEILDLLAHGLSPLFEQILHLQKRVKYVWVSLDLDVVDGVYAPGVGIPNNGGLTYREIAAICTFIGKKCTIMGMDIVEYNPLYDNENKTAELAIELTAKLLGTDFSSYSKYLKEHSLT